MLLSKNEKEITSKSNWSTLCNTLKQNLLTTVMSKSRKVSCHKLSL